MKINLYKCAWPLRVFVAVQDGGHIVVRMEFRSGTIDKNGNAMVECLDVEVPLCGN